MKKPTPTYDQFDVVVVPFPFTDKSSEKRRPAVVISKRSSFNSRVQKYILAMITSSTAESWPGDSKITDLKKSGLTHSSIIRLKLFTLDQDIVIRRLGALGANDKLNLRKSIRRIMI